MAKDRKTHDSSLLFWKFDRFWLRYANSSACSLCRSESKLRSIASERRSRPRVKESLLMVEDVEEAGRLTMMEGVDVTDTILFSKDQCKDS